MRAIVLGATGFAGGYLVEHLLAQGDEVCGAARSEKWPAELAHLEPSVPLWTCDLSGPLSPEFAGKFHAFQPEAVYLLAALCAPGAAAQWPLEAWRLHAGGTQRIVELAASMEQPPRLLYVSTSAVYGEPPAEAGPLDERAPLHLTAIYPASKFVGEEIVLAANRQGVPSVIARAFNHTGPRQPRLYLAPTLAAQATEEGNEPVRVQSLSTWLDLCDVRDVARAYRALIVRGTPGETYNVGSGVARSSGDLLHALLELVGRTREVIETQPGERRRPLACVEKIAREVGWHAEIPWNDTLRSLVTYWRSRVHPSKSTPRGNNA